MNHETLTGFLRRKQINISVQTYLIDALGAMAFGLFASLLIGTIFGTLGEKTGIEIFNTIAVYAKGATGAALGVSISYALKSPQLVIFSAATVGIAGNELGGPVGALAATIIASELGKLVSKETQGGYSRHSGRHHYLRRPHRPARRPRRLRLHDWLRRSGKNCHCHAAPLHGNPGICPHRHCPDSSHQQRGDLHYAEPGWTGRRSRHCPAAAPR